MKREIGKLTVLITAPILLSFVWNIYAIETLADYGPTLRGLSPEESIIVHANLIKDSDHKIMRIVRIKKDKTSEIIQHPDRILFRVAKRDIDAYASQKIDLDTFKKRVAITEM